MMQISSLVWRSMFILAFSLMILAGLAAEPVWPDGEAKPAAPPPKNMDLALFTEEIQAAGALKFYESTEEILRLAQFERALLRYRFLKGQIAGQPLYRGLAVQIDRRLKFLGEQLKLGPGELGGVGTYSKTRRRRVAAPRAAAAKEVAPKKPEAATAAGKKEAATPSPKEEAPSTKEEAPAPETAKAPAPGKEAGAIPPPVAEGGEPLKSEVGEKTQKEAEGKTKPAAPTSRWDRVKQKLQFWKKTSPEETGQ